MEDVEPGHVAWSREMFRVLNIGGIWGIPRSGLIFTRTGENELALTAVMPHDPAMPVTPAELLEQQESDYAGVKLHMGLADIQVTDSTNTF